MYILGLSVLIPFSILFIIHSLSKWFKTKTLTIENNKLKDRVEELSKSNKSTYLNELPIPPQAEYCSHDWHTVTDKIIELPDKKTHTVVLKCVKCGVLDKTINTIKIEPKPVPVKDCRHKWKTKIREEFPSAYEQLHETLVFINKQYGASGKTALIKSITNKIEESGNDEMLFRKAFVRVDECIHCGKRYEVKGANYNEDDDSTDPSPIEHCCDC